MSNIFHRIKAVLLPNRLITAQKGEYHARVISERALDIAAICQSAVERGQVATNADSMSNHVKLFLKEMSYLLKDGYCVNTGYFKAAPQIKGIFISETDQFDPERHAVYFRFTQGEHLREGIDELEVAITGMAKTEIMIDRVLDVKSNTINQLLTPNHSLKIQGEKLKLAGDHPSVGVYLISESTSERISIEPSDIVTNTPREVIVHLPELHPGNYYLEITSQYSTGKILKEPRTTVFDQVLTVL